jgi:LPXTG-motif cell wall-anchored protein
MRSARQHWRTSIGTALAGVLVAAGMVVAPSPAAAAESYQRLAGVTTVETSTSGVATVELSAPAMLSFGSGGFGPGSTGVYGGGRIIAMVLEQNGRIIFEAVQLRDCGSAGCRRGLGFGFSFGTLRTLRPGLYHLYVVADGAPVTAVLGFQGLDGSSRVAVAPSSAIVMRDLATLLPSTGTGMDPGVYSVSDSDTIGDQGGLLVSNISVSTSSFVGGYWGACLTQGAPQPAYVANCSVSIDQETRDNLENPALICDPTNEPPLQLPDDVINNNIPCTDPWTQRAVTNGLPFPFGFGWVAGVPRGQGGTWGLGGYVDGAMLLKSENAVGLWLSFVPQERTVTVAPPSPATAPPTTPSPQPAATPAPVLTQLPNTGTGTSAVGAAGGAALLIVGLLRRRRRRR